MPASSRGTEPFNFFAEALIGKGRFGNPIIKPGITVITDNCGLHHAILTEQALTGMLHDDGVTYIS